MAKIGRANYLSTVLAVGSVTDLGSIDTKKIRLNSGVGPVLSFGTTPNLEKDVYCAVNFTVIRDAVALEILPGHASIDFKIGDRFKAVSDVAGNWAIVGILRASWTDAIADLGLTIGGTIQAHSTNLDAFSGLLLSADKLPYSTSATAMATTSFTPAGRALIDDADNAAQRITLGLQIGVDVAPFGAIATGNVVYYDTLALLNANTTALFGSVLLDGANNGSYGRTSPNNPATAWILKSKATIPALDTRVTVNEGAITSLQGITFATFKGVWAVSPQGYVRPILDEWGEEAQYNPWPLRFGGYQIFPDQNGYGLGRIDPQGGFVRDFKIWGMNTKIFMPFEGYTLLDSQGNARPVLDAYGEVVLAYPWPTRFSGYQIFPDQNGKGLGQIEPVAGYVKNFKIHGVNQLGFGVGWGPMDVNGNYAFYVDLTTGALITRTSGSSLYKAFTVDHTDHGRNIGILALDGRQVTLTYDEGFCTLNSLTDFSIRVVRYSTYAIGLVGDTLIVPVSTATYHDLSLIVAPFTLSGARTKLRYYPGRGQSDWVGAHSDPPLTTTPNNPGVAKMFVGGAGCYTGGTASWTSPPNESNFASIVDLREGIGGSPTVESPMSGLASQIVQGFASDSAGLFCTYAIGGSDYDKLARGTWNFETVRLGYIYHLLHCFLNNFTPVLGGVTIGWASSDALENMSQANYRTRMITEQAWHQRCKAELYRDLTDLVCYFIIETAFPDWSQNTGPFKAQWQLHNQFPTKFRVVASDQNRDEVVRAGGTGDPAFVHYSNHGDLHIGEMAGYGVKQVETAQPYPCVAVIGATPNFASSYVDVTVSLMSGSLVVDTSGTLETDPGNLGMYWTQTGGTTRTLVSAAIQNANNGDNTATVRLTLSGNPGSPTYWEVGAIFGQLTQTRPNGPHAPLRDGSSITSLDGATIHPGWIVPSYVPSTGW